MSRQSSAPPTNSIPINRSNEPDFMEELYAWRAEISERCGYDLQRIHDEMVRDLDLSKIRWADIEPVKPKPQPEE